MTGIAVLLALLAMIGPFSIDTYLPAFPAMAGSLRATPLQIQQTLTAYLLPFAVMMLWHGAIADALGRRRVILCGLAVYSLASLLCALTNRLELLLLGRVLQGLSAGAGTVIGRAVVRDLHEGAAAQRLMAHVSMLFAIAPALAPILGGWLHGLFGWQAIFFFLALFGGALWLAVFLRLPETLPAEARQPLHPARLWHAYREVFSGRVFVGLSLALACNFNGMFLYVLSSPVFLIKHLHLTPQDFAWLFVPSVAGMMLGSFFSGRLAGRLSSRSTILLGYLLMGLAAAGNIGINLLLPPSLPWMILPLPLYTIGMALTVPSLQLLALDLHPQRRGLASSCQGLIQTSLIVLSAAVLAPLLWATPLLLAGGMAASMVCGLLAFMIACRIGAPQKQGA
ncbi:putative MFS transporter [Sterolibacterium denitrificans]|uniref:Bcr/CflA family efflux transporter n=2 Tax=Sterolibacterium denitrificans TaxID=157592 RepID=A0A7Z7HQJ9_9PROT|nr:putative MFS transporter [Sterolibacterium denitrificans]